MISTKGNLSNEKFEQVTGSTITLSGNTIIKNSGSFTFGNFDDGTSFRLENAAITIKKEKGYDTDLVAATGIDIEYAFQGFSSPNLQFTVRANSNITGGVKVYFARVYGNFNQEQFYIIDETELIGVSGPELLNVGVPDATWVLIIVPNDQNTYPYITYTDINTLSGVSVYVNCTDDSSRRDTIEYLHSIYSSSWEWPQNGSGFLNPYIANAMASISSYVFTNSKHEFIGDVILSNIAAPTGETYQLVINDQGRIETISSSIPNPLILEGSSSSIQFDDTNNFGGVAHIDYVTTGTADSELTISNRIFGTTGNLNIRAGTNLELSSYNYGDVNIISGNFGGGINLNTVNEGYVNLYTGSIDLVAYTGNITLSPENGSIVMPYIAALTTGQTYQLVIDENGIVTSELITTGSTGSSVLSDITAATDSNTINNGANHQIWDWNSLTSGTGMSFRSSSTGATSNTLKVVSVEKSGTNSNSGQTTRALNVSNTSAGTTSTNVALEANASGGTNNYAIRTTTGDVLFATSVSQGVYFGTSTSSPNIKTGSARRVIFDMLGADSVTQPSFIFSTNSASIQTSGQGTFFRMSNNAFSPTSGTATYDFLELLGTINQTGGANGQTRGVRVRPTHTSTSSFVAFDYSPVIGTPTSDLSFRATQGNMLVPASSYHNFGTTVGSGGYGFRDNAGTMEYKDSGGTWTAFSSISGGSGSSTYIFDNGLTESGGIVSLGGTLTGNTIIDVTSFDLVLDIQTSGTGFVRGTIGSDNDVQLIKFRAAGANSAAGLTDVNIGPDNGTNIAASGNIILGQRNLRSLSGTGEFSGGRNIAIGFENFGSRTTGTHGIAIGRRNMYNLTGSNAGQGLNYATAIGYETILNGVFNSSSALDSSFIAGTTTLGRRTFPANSEGVIAIGWNTGGLPSGNPNSRSILADGMFSTILLGTSAGYDASFERYEIMIGDSAGRRSVVGRGNLFIGALAGADMTGGTTGSAGVGNVQFNVAIGTHTLQYGSGNKNTFVGTEAGSTSVQGNQHTGVGNWALNRTNGNFNTGLGAYAGYNGSTTLVGSGNTFVGYYASYSASTFNNSIVIATNWQGANTSNRIYLGNTNQKVILNSTPAISVSNSEYLVRDSINGEIKTKPINVLNGVIVSDSYTATTSSYYIGVAATAATTIYLPQTPNNFQKIIINDISGNADINNITIDGNGYDIIGSSTAVIDSQYSTISLIFNTINWSIISSF